VTPGKYDLSLYRGDSARWEFTLWADAGRTEAVDLTGVTTKAEMRVSAGGVLVTTFVTAVVMPNKVTMSLSAVVSGTLSKVGGVWDLQLTYAGGDVCTVLQGRVSVTEDVTDSGGLPLQLRVVR
jgi:hypothetical protein